MPDSRCPICGLKARVEPLSVRDAAYIECNQCGACVMDAVLLGILHKKHLTATEEQLLPCRSAFLRQQTDQGTVIELELKNWRAYARGHTVGVRS
jgi:hypothetical protein